MKRALKIAGIVLAVILAIPVLALVLTFAGNPSIPDGKELPGGARLVKDGYVAAFVLPLGDGNVALVDCGNDAEGKAVLAELDRQKLAREAVKAIFLTHGHQDHVKACHLFSAAQVFAMESEREVLEGRAKFKGPMTRLFPAKDTGVRVTRPIADGETVTIGTLQVTAFAVPGHTPGSAGYLAGGVLYLGDSADAKKDGTMVGSKWLFSDSSAQNRASLVALAARLTPRAQEVKMLAFAHTGVLDGFGPLASFAAK
jgi:glyoxylase-like metal-dependent hydrolase (beta-lactamase superfamily II)